MDPERCLDTSEFSIRMSPARSVDNGTFSPFSHLNTDRAGLYRAIMQQFVQAKAAYSVHLRPEDLANALPSYTLDEIRSGLDSLTEWGNLEAHPDTGRVTTVEDFNRKRFLYQMSERGEAAEQGLAIYAQALERRGALQSVALQDIRERLMALQTLLGEDPDDPAKLHSLLRDLNNVFSDLAGNAQAFMADLGRTLELRSGDSEQFLAYKRRLIDYLERFIGDLTVYSAEIADLLEQLNRLSPEGKDEKPGAMLVRAFRGVARREALDLAPGLEPGVGPDADASFGDAERILETARLEQRWTQRWQGLCHWFTGSAEHPSQSVLLRKRAMASIPRLLETVTRLNEKRMGRSDRSADFLTLARWFAGLDDEDAHRLWRQAFGLTPTRHLALTDATEQGDRRSGLSWLQTPGIPISPRLRSTGHYQRGGAPRRIRDRGAEKAKIARIEAVRTAQAHAARRRLLSDERIQLSALGRLDSAEFGLFLELLGQALAAMPPDCDQVVTHSYDGQLEILLQLMGPETRAVVHTPDGLFYGRDHWLHIREV